MSVILSIYNEDNTCNKAIYPTLDLAIKASKIIKNYNPKIIIKCKIILTKSIDK